MKIYQHIDEFSGVKNPIVTIGTFDGVHLGHQKIIELMKGDAEKHDGETVVITFYPHPRLVLHADSKNLKFRIFNLITKLWNLNIEFLV